MLRINELRLYPQLQTALCVTREDGFTAAQCPEQRLVGAICAHPTWFTLTPPHL